MKGFKKGNAYRKKDGWQSFQLFDIVKLFHGHDNHESLKLIEIKPLSAIDRLEDSGNLILQNFTLASELNMDHPGLILADCPRGKSKLD